MSLEIVKVLPSDEQHIEACREILYEYFEMRDFDAAMGDYKTELKQLPGLFSPEQGGVLFLAYYDDEPVGTIAYKQMKDRNYCEMKRLYVKPEMRGKKIGLKLVGKLIDDAKEHNYRFMRLDNHPWMDAAESIYKYYGFERIEPYWDNPTEGARYFELDLTK